MIATMGGRFGGYGLYLLKGKPVFGLQYYLDLRAGRGCGTDDWLGKGLRTGQAHDCIELRPWVRACVAIAGD